MSHRARFFVAPLTLQTLSGNKVFEDMFTPAQDYEPTHISLAEKTDLVLVMPATADIIAKTACGICDELLTCVISSTNAPVLFAPAMNKAMYTNPILRANISALKKLKYHFVGPIAGHLACGVTGIGHIAHTQDIIRKAKALLK
jgi:phosphopantothenoylcysteine decarboxylase/phosphopantothenate--cysteine ligase